MLRKLTRALALAIVPCAVAIAAEAPPLRETVFPQFQHALPDSEGKTLTSVVVDYPPGAKSAPHRHAKSAFIYAYVLSGTIRSQVDDQPVKDYRAGESFFEMPGAHHTVSENASTSEPAKMLVVFIVKVGDTPLTIADPH